MPIFGRFTQRAQRAIAAAQEAAVKLHQSYVGTEHILLGLLKEPGPVIAGVLPENITYDAVFEQVRTVLGEGTAQQRMTMPDMGAMPDGQGMGAMPGMQSPL